MTKTANVGNTQIRERAAPRASLLSAAARTPPPRRLYCLEFLAIFRNKSMTWGRGLGKYNTDQRGSNDYGKRLIGWCQAQSPVNSMLGAT